MARQVIDDRILEQTATSGVDDITLTGALDSFNSFSSKLSNAEECIFCIEDSANNAYEISKGTYTSATNSLSRDSVLSSSNSDAKVAFQAGNKRVFLAYSAEEIKQYVEGSFKNSVRVASTENIALSTGIANSSVIDGITIATNDRVALLGQIDSTKNGVWIAQSSGMPIRATDFDNDNKISAGLIFNVEIGTNAGLWKLTTPGNIVLETTSLTFSRVTEQSNNNDYDVAANSDLNALIPTANGKFRYEINNPTNAPSGVSGQIFVTANRQGQDLVQIIYDTDAIYIRGGRGTYTSSWVNLNDVGLKVISTDSTITGNGTSGSPLSIANEFTSAEKTKLATIASGATRTELADDLLDPANFADGDVFICDSAINNITFGSNTYNFAEGAVLEKFGGAANSHWSDTGHSIRLFFRGAWVNLGGYHAGNYVTHSNTLWFARTNIGSNVEPNDTNTDWVRVGGGATSAQVTAIAANTAKRTYPSGDQLKLAGIEAGATADQTAAEIATSLGTLTGANRLDASAVQNLPQPGDGGLSSVATGTSLTGLGTNADPLNVTNPFTDADETKLDGIATGATVGATATQASAITDNTAKRTYPSDDETKLAGIETGATVGATTAQETAISANTAKRSYPQTDETKLDGIASGATVGATPAQVTAIAANTTKLATIASGATRTEIADDLPDPANFADGDVFICDSAINNVTFGSTTYNFDSGAVLEKFGGTANPHWSSTGHSVRLFFRGAWANPGGYHAGSYVTHSNTLWFARVNIASGVEPNDTNSDWVRLGGGATTAQASAITANTAKRSYPSADQTKLAGIATNATAGASLTQALAITDNTSKRTYPQADETKLAGIETAATTDQTAAELVTSLQTLSGANRLDASAIQNLPQPQGGGLASVATDATLAGLGTNADPLNVTNPFTDADETKLDGIAAGAEVNVQSDWNALAGAALILNKPAIPTLSTDTQFETGTSTTLAPQVAQVTRATEAVSQILSSWDGSSNPATSVQVGPIPTVTAGTINTSPYDTINDRFIVSSATGGNSGLAYQARLEWSNSLIDWKRTAFCYDTEQEAGNWQLITYFGSTTSPNNINQNASGGGFGVGIFRVSSPADTYLFALTPYIGSGGSGGEIVPTAFFNGAVTNAIPGDLVNFNGFNITETNPRMRVMIVRNERVISFYVNRLLRAEFTLTPAQNSRATGSRYGFFGDGGNAKRVYLYGLSVGNPALSLLDRNCLPLEGATPAQATAITANTTNSQLDFTAASISGNTLTITRRNNTTVALTLPAGGGSSNTYDASTTSDLNALIPTTTGQYNYSISNPTNGPAGVGTQVFVTVNRQGNDLVQVLYDNDAIYVRGGRNSYTTSWIDLSAGEANVNADWNADSGDAEILNKPTINPLANTTLASARANPNTALESGETPIANTQEVTINSTLNANINQPHVQKIIHNGRFKIVSEAYTSTNTDIIVLTADQDSITEVSRITANTITCTSGVWDEARGRYYSVDTVDSQGRLSGIAQFNISDTGMITKDSTVHAFTSSNFASELLALNWDGSTLAVVNTAEISMFDVTDAGVIFRNNIGLQAITGSNVTADNVALFNTNGTRAGLHAVHFFDNNTMIATTALLPFALPYNTFPVAWIFNISKTGNNYSLTTHRSYTSLDLEANILPNQYPTAQPITLTDDIGVLGDTAVLGLETGLTKAQVLKLVKVSSPDVVTIPTDAAEVSYIGETDGTYIYASSQLGSRGSSHIYRIDPITLDCHRAEVTTGPATTDGVNELGFYKGLMHMTTFDGSAKVRQVATATLDWEARDVYRGVVQGIVTSPTDHAANGTRSIAWSIPPGSYTLTSTAQLVLTSAASILSVNIRYSTPTNNLIHESSLTASGQASQTLNENATITVENTGTTNITLTARVAVVTANGEVDVIANNLTFTYTSLEVGLVRKAIPTVPFENVVGIGRRVNNNFLQTTSNGVVWGNVPLGQFVSGFNIAQGNLNTLNISPGICRDHLTGAVTLQSTAIINKNIGTVWAEGTNQGGRLNTTTGSNFYGVFVFQKDSDGSLDAGFYSLPSLFFVPPTGYTHFRRIGYIYVTETSGTYVMQPFNAFPIEGGGHRWEHSASLLVGQFTFSTTTTLRTVGVPNAEIDAILSVWSTSTVNALWITSPLKPGTTNVSQTNFTLVNTSSGHIVRTNASAQVNVDASATSAGVYNLVTEGFIDRRQD